MKVIILNIFIFYFIFVHNILFVSDFSYAQIRINQNNETKVYLSPKGRVSVNPNIRVHPSNTSQTEVILTSHPSNADIMFGSANTMQMGIVRNGCYVTTNGGLSWYGTDQMPTLPFHLSDPSTVIDKNGWFIFTTLSLLQNTSFKLISCYSTNFGITWSSPYVIDNNPSDKDMAATDDIPLSPYYGRTYVAWTRTVPVAPIGVSWTTNGGISWVQPKQINNPTSTISFGADIIIGPQGQVYVSWSAFTNYYEYIGFAKSYNGGDNWQVNEQIYNSSHAETGNLNGWNVRMIYFPRMGVDKTNGPHRGWIYIVDCEKNLFPAGSDEDIILHRSTDQGITWSEGIRVNQDLLNNGKVQFFPAIRVDESGAINIVYYDNRNYPSYGDSCEVYLSRSIDGGNSWRDIKISDHAWKPSPEMGSYMGDYIGITSGNNVVWPFWFDNRTGLYQAWTAKVEPGPYIIHTPLSNTEQISGNRQVDCIIVPEGYGVNPNKTKLFFSKNNISFTDSILMTSLGGNNWTGNLSLSGSGLYRYYISAIDSLNRVATSPGGAPGIYYSFIAEIDTISPTIVHTPLNNTPLQDWPAIVSANVSDNIGVDSVWVRWYKNNPVTGIKHFRLINTSGIVYSANFNSDTSQVHDQDSIFYRIFARDKSANHNTDSTQLYNIKIINVNISCSGNGNTIVWYPFNTFFNNSKTDMLWTASEIISNNGCRGLIYKIGYNDSVFSSQIMNGFNIKMQNTSLISLNGFVQNGWTNVYTGTYSVSGTGIQYINLQTPFFWNGTSNLLLEICFANNNWTVPTKVFATYAPGKTWTEPNDDTSGCILSGGSMQNYRPNICFSIIPTSIENNIISLPLKFYLSQNYPNPFNPMTKIRFDIQGSVKGNMLVGKLIVYDILGKEIITLVNESLQPGTYETTFDGSKLPSGLYFYKFTCGDFSEVKKMVLIK